MKGTIIMSALVGAVSGWAFYTIDIVGIKFLPWLMLIFVMCNYIAYMVMDFSKKENDKRDN